MLGGKFIGLQQSILNHLFMITPSPRTKLEELFKAVGEAGTVGIPDSIGYLLKTVIRITQQVAGIIHSRLGQ